MQFAHRQHWLEAWETKELKDFLVVIDVGQFLEVVKQKMGESQEGL